MIFYRCNKCKLYIPAQRTCQIMIPQMQGKISPEDYCSQFQAEVNVCEICGGGILQPFIEIEGEDKVHTYCQNCLMMREQQQWAAAQQQNQENPSE